jgi:GNAT superfamily N-acetyltransferase
MIEIKPIDEKTRKDVIDIISKNWCGPVIVTKGKIHSAEDLPGFLAVEDNVIKGLITYSMNNEDCEIVSLDSFYENQGTGIMLIDRVIDMAKEYRCKRLWLITTNDNAHAIRFYQKHGFILINIYLNSIKESRRIKPQIPLYGMDGIPILHEIEFEKII